MHRTPSKVVIPNLSESLKKYANLCELSKTFMLINKINFSLLTLFSLLIYIFCGRGLKGQAGCRLKTARGRGAPISVLITFRCLRLVNGHRFTDPGLPWWSPIQVLTESTQLIFGERATDLALVATVSLQIIWYNMMVIYPGFKATIFCFLQAWT